MKKWLRAQPDQPTTIAELQTLLDAFVDEYNHRRPHRSLPHRATPATALHTHAQSHPRQPTAAPTPTTGSATTRIDKAGTVTLRIAGRLRHIGVGRTHAGTCVILLVQDLAHPRRQRRHRRTPPRPDHRPTTRLPAHRHDHPAPPRNEVARTCRSQVRAVADVLRHHMVGLTGFEPAVSSSRTRRASHYATPRFGDSRRPPEGLWNRLRADDGNRTRVISLED